MDTMNSLILIQNIQKENLYVETIQQLNKDFQLANIDKSISIEITSTQLKNELNSCVLDLLTNDYDGYLNLLYRIDVKENDLRKLAGESLVENVSNISILILKREFQKVWFKKKYSK